MEQQQSQPLPVAVPVDCSQGNGPIPAVLPAIGGHSSSSVAGDGWSGGTLQFPSPITARDLPRVNHAMHTRGSSTSSGIGGAEGGRTDTTAGSLRRLAAQYPVVHQLASGNSDVLVEMRQIVVGQMDVCPGVQIDRVSVEEYVLREVTVLVQMTEGFKAVTVSTDASPKAKQRCVDSAGNPVSTNGSEDGPCPCELAGSCDASRTLRQGCLPRINSQHRVYRCRPIELRCLAQSLERHATRRTGKANARCLSATMLAFVSRGTSRSPTIGWRSCHPRRSRR